MHSVAQLQCGARFRQWSFVIRRSPEARRARRARRRRSERASATPRVLRLPSSQPQAAVHARGRASASHGAAEGDHRRRAARASPRRSAPRPAACPPRRPKACSPARTRPAFPSLPVPSRRHRPESARRPGARGAVDLRLLAHGPNPLFAHHPPARQVPVARAHRQEAPDPFRCGRWDWSWSPSATAARGGRRSRRLRSSSSRRSSPRSSRRCTTSTTSSPRPRGTRSPSPADSAAPNLCPQGLPVPLPARAQPAAAHFLP